FYRAAEVDASRQRVQAAKAGLARSPRQALLCGSPEGPRCGDPRELTSEQLHEYAVANRFAYERSSSQEVLADTQDLYNEYGAGVTSVTVDGKRVYEFEKIARAGIENRKGFANIEYRIGGE